jgi:hypothetical protein
MQRRAFYVVYALLAGIVVALTMYQPLRPWLPWGLGAVVAVVVVAPTVWLIYAWRRARKPVRITVAINGVTVNQCTGVAFSRDDARFGVWSTAGVALHLRSGSQDFVLGGRDRRIGPEVQFDAPPVTSVDAWLWAGDFDELLAAAGLDGLRGPVSGQPTRFLLYPNPSLAEEFGPLAVRDHVRLQRSLGQPTLVVDVGETVRVTDPSTDAADPEVRRDQLTAAAAVFQPRGTVSGDGTSYDYAATVGLVVRLPGRRPLTIGCQDLDGLRARFSWRGDPSRLPERPAYVVSGGDFAVLAELFGLAQHLEDHA